MKKRMVTAVLAMAAILLFSAGCGSADTLGMQKDSVYYVYLGLDDLDTGTQLLTEEEATSAILAVLESVQQGATILPTTGTYLDNDGLFHRNGTMLVIINCEEETVEDLMSRWKEALHISAVYVERYDVSCALFGGQL